MKQSRSITTRDQLLANAAQLFADHGYDATGVAEICKVTGVSKGAFYHHFPSKHALFMALLNNWLEGVDLSLASISVQYKSVPEKILGMVEVIPEIILTGQSNLGIFMEFWTQAKRDPEIWETAIHPYRKYENYFTGLVLQGIQEGSIPSGDPVLLAHKIISMIVGVLFQAVLSPSGVDWRLVALGGIKSILGMEKSQ